MERGTFTVKAGHAEMLKGGVIMDVVTAEQAKIAENAGVRLVHENEHAIYGDDPDRVADLMQNVDHPALGAVYDPANYVFCGYDPWQGWQMTKEWTVHFHIKDWVQGETHGRPAGEGHGRIPEVMAEAVARKKPAPVDLHVMATEGHRVHATAHEEAARWILEQMGQEGR